MNYRIAVVSGGTSGIGRMIAAGFVQMGYRVLICARNETRCREVAAEMSTAETGAGSCAGIPCDVTSGADIERLVRDVENEHGGIDVLVNNAGAVTISSIETYTVAEWDDVLKINLKSVFFMTQKFLPLLLRRANDERPSSIINIGSIGGIMVGPRDNYAYQASKAGMHHMTRMMARRFGPRNVTVNAIAAGYFPSEILTSALTPAEVTALNAQVPVGRVGQAEDIAGLTTFLASEEATFLTGAVIPLDGGVSA